MKNENLGVGEEKSHFEQIKYFLFGHMLL